MFVTLIQSAVGNLDPGYLGDIIAIPSLEYGEQKLLMRVGSDAIGSPRISQHLQLVTNNLKVQIRKKTTPFKLWLGVWDDYQTCPINR